MAAVMSWEARSDCIASGVVHLGADPEPQRRPEPDYFRADHAPAAFSLAMGGTSDAGPMPS
jgi:hypothetical protein